MEHQANVLQQIEDQKNPKGVTPLCLGLIKLYNNCTLTKEKQNV